MIYTVSGLDRDTGAAKDVCVDAPDPDQAVTRANDLGIVVSKVQAAPEQSSILVPLLIPIAGLLIGAIKYGTGRDGAAEIFWSVIGAVLWMTLFSIGRH